ncbi:MULTISPECIES: site-specific integrase [unclassified Thioalkalivibrio]|uniref:site-specific integrase n=1 Tax=unclassified Thioalkalivibrio TaxID=2621013 RepID=UPI00037DB84C|nr:MULTISPECIES: site-specific integrase [unclassified Thioalkalivibrio]
MSDTSGEPGDGGLDDDPRAIWAGWTHLWNPIGERQPDPTEATREEPQDGDEFLSVWRILKEQYPRLTSVEPPEDLKWTKSDTRTLMLQVRAEAPAGRSFVAQRRVAEILDTGNRVGRWRIVIPDLPVPLPPAPSSPFQHHDFLDMVRHQDLVDTFRNQLASPIDPERIQARWGRIFLSALLFGGLLRPRWLWALGHSLHQAPAHHHWIELYHQLKDETMPLHLRWYPDPITRHLLVRDGNKGLPPGLPGTRADGPLLYRWIRECAETLGFSDQLPRNWSQLQKVARLHLALYVPPYLLAHAAGERVATSLPVSVHERLIFPPDRIRTSLPPRATEPGHRSEISEHGSAPAEGATTEGDADPHGHEAWPAQLLDLTRLIRKNDPPDPQPIRDWIEAHPTANPTGGRTPLPLLPSVRRLADWVANRLCTPARAGRKPRRRTVYELYNAVAGRIAGQLGDTDPADLTADDLIELYTSALEDTPNARSRKRVARGIRSFHQFLMEAHSRSPLPLETLESPQHVATHGPPDANYLDEALFQRTLDWVDELYRDNPAVGTVLTLIMALGFYGGLRRSEAAGILIGDLEGPPEYSLLVRPNGLRLLKSGNAQRVLPLHAMLPEALLERLTRWQEHRRAEPDGSEAAPLFALPDRGPIRPNDQLLDAATRAMTQVTGDPDIRFHHLRHSFASRTLLHFWELEGEGEEPLPPWSQARSMAAPTDPRKLRRELIGDHSPTQRRTLRLVSRLMGHSDTQITIEHYVHTLDDLLGRAVRRVIDGLDTRQIAAITGRSAPRIREVRRETHFGTPGEIIDRITDGLPPSGSSLTKLRERTAAGTQCGTPVPIEEPADPLDRACLLIRAINETECSTGSPTGQFAFPWDRPTLERYAALLRTLPQELRLRRSRPDDPDCLLAPPHVNERPTFQTTWSYLYGNEQTPALTPRDRKKLLDTFTHAMVPTAPLLTLQLTSVPDLKRWVRLLDHLELRELFIGYHTAKPGSRAANPSEQLQHWRHKAGHLLSIEHGPMGHPSREATAARGEVIVTFHPDAQKAVSLSPYAVQLAIFLAWAQEHHENRT